MSPMLLIRILKDFVSQKIKKICVISNRLACIWRLYGYHLYRGSRKYITKFYQRFDKFVCAAVSPCVSVMPRSSPNFHTVWFSAG